MTLKHQRGFLSLVAILLIVVIGFLGLAVAYMWTGNITATSNFAQSAKTFYIAEAGLEKATRFLLTPLLTGANTRISCTALTGNASLTNSSFGAGTFTDTTVSGEPNNANSTLSGTISSSALSLTVASTTGFASTGRILIDGEAINYGGISSNTFIGLTRGANSTIAASHSNGARVSQYQCTLDATAGIPNLTMPLTKRELQNSVQLQEAWGVGNRASNDFVLTHWNQPTELQWTNTSYTDATNRDNLNSVSLLSNNEGWAVGDEINTNFTILHLNGTSFSTTPVSGACASQNLLSTMIVSSQEAWAVGVRNRVTNCTSGNYRYAILRWNGTSWTKLTAATSPSIPADGSNSAIQNLNGVAVIDTAGSGTANFGFAVGDTGTILQYNGSQWLSVSSPIGNKLNSVAVVSSSEAWAVGAAGRIIKWNGTSWGTYTSPTGTALNSISMLDTDGDGLANYGWAVGNSGTCIIYNGSTWSSQNAGGVALNGVAILDTDDVWAVGNGGRVTHWDGTAWTDMTSNVGAQLNAIATIKPAIYPTSGWREIFP